MIGVFTDQAYNSILLAEDEARMLGRAAVEPEHLLLALARQGSVESLLSRRGVTASDIHAALMRADGLGEDLVLGQVPRSPAAEDALERAVDAAAARGALSPSNEHLLLGLRVDASAMGLLEEVGITDVAELVDEPDPIRRAPPLSVEQVKSHALRADATRSPPRPGPIPPVFERFTSPARRAVGAAERMAEALGHEYVAPLHVLLGLLHAEGSLANDVLGRQGVTLENATRAAQICGGAHARQPTGIFADATRRLVAEEALRHAYRHDHVRIGTGHLLLATIDAADPTTILILGAGPTAERIALATTKALPGEDGP